MYSKSPTYNGGGGGIKTLSAPPKASGPPTMSTARKSKVGGPVGESSTALVPFGEPQTGDRPNGGGTGTGTGTGGPRPSRAVPLGDASTFKVAQAAPPRSTASFTVLSHQAAEQMFNYFLVLNLQATCDVHSRPQPEPREVIEFSAAKVNGQTFAVESIFHQYVSPKINKKLTKYCTQLTGISQCMIDGQSLLEPTMRKFHVWVAEQGLFKPNVTFAVVTHGDWYLQQLLPKNLGATSPAALPEFFRKWIDISKTFMNRLGADPSDELDPLAAMLKMFNLELQGPRHSGIYVCHNIIQIMKALATENQCVLRITSP